MSNSVVLETMAKAMYDRAIKRAKEEIEALDFNANDLPEVFSKLSEETQTGQVLIFASYIEDRLLQLLRLRMRNLISNDDEDSVFGQYGPLNSFGSRILLAYQLDWISVQTKTHLDSFRKIRNRFAHEAFKVNFQDREVNDRFSRIQLGFVSQMKGATDALHTTESSDEYLKYEEIASEKMILCTMALLACQIFTELMVLPIAQRHNVDPSSLLNHYDSLPDNIRTIFLLGATAVHDIIEIHQVENQG